MTLIKVLGGLVALILTVCVLSCKKDTPNPVGPGGGGNGGTGGSVSDSSRTAVLDSLTAKINQLPQESRDADNQAIYAYVQTRPEFSASGIRPSGVWAVFQDGRPWAFVNNLEGLDTTWNRPVPTIIAASSSRNMMTPSENLPTNNGARVMNSLGSAFDYNGVGQLGFTEAANDIRSWLQDAGYTPVSSSPSVDDLKTVAGDGVFYCSAHGDNIKLADGSWVYGMWTSTQRTPAGDLLYKNDLDSGRLGYFTAAHVRGGILSRDVAETHYAITYKFVRQYMSFGPRSVVFINGCLSGDATFRDACIAKGADLYLGWSNYVESFHAVRIAHFCFDRALGANVERPVLDPPQKGYQLYDVLPFMMSTGRASTVHPTYGTANLVDYPSPSDVTLLRPLIYSVTPLQNELRILGWFGENPGAGAATVRVGNTTVPIQNWVSASTLSCAPVQDGGDVIVSVRGRKSKPVPLTKFHGTFEYTVLGQGTLRKHVVVTLEFLADVRTNRIRVDESPQWEIPRMIFAVNSTGATYEASGEYRDQQGNLVESWSGSGSLPLLPLGTTGNGVTVTGFIDRTGLAQSIVSVGGTIPYTRNGSASTFSISSSVASLLTQMTDQFVIPGHTYTGGGSESTTGMFSDITSTFAPTGSTVR